MSDRAKNFMNQVWERRNNGADTEEKLVSSILSLVAENVRAYTAQNNLIVLDQNELIDLSNEIANLPTET